MSSGLTPYPAYKPSGVEWLGQVPATKGTAQTTLPAGWRWAKLRYECERIVSVDPRKEPDREIMYVDISSIDHALKQIISTQRLVGHRAPSRARQLVRKNDTLVSTTRPNLNAVAKVPSLLDGAVCSTGFCVLRPHSSLDSSYLFYFVQTKGFVTSLSVLGKGTTYPAVTDWQVLAQLIPLPPLPEQAAIVRYLGSMDRRIRRYILAKERLIELLEEEKQAIIHRAVTRGLDPNVPLKPSGVDWLGQVPAHWEVARLGRLIDLTTGFPFKSEGFTGNIDDTRLLRGINISPGHVRWDDVVYWPAVDRRNRSSYELQSGDIVLGMDRPIIKAGCRVAVIDDSDLPCLLLQRVARIRCRHGLLSDYLYILLAGMSFTTYLSPIFTGISVPHLSPEQISLFRFPLPSVDEQTAIVRYLEETAADIETATSQAQREIDLLNEYRTRLIADVVTGKLDVREAARALPEDPDDELAVAEDPVAEELGV